eukprot:jgi/Botrbrau1/14248/Bobra.0381s0009.1
MRVLQLILVSVFGYLAYTILPKVYWWIRARRMLRHLPREPEESSTLIGASEAAMGVQRHLVYVDLVKERAAAVTRLLWIQIMLVSDPGMVEEIHLHPKLYKPVRYLYELLHPLLNSSVAVPDLETAEGGPSDNLWKVLRKGIAPAFTLQNIKQTAFPVMAKKSRALMEVLRQRGPSTPVEMSNAAMCFAIDTIAEWGFGIDLGNVNSLYSTNENPLVKTIADGAKHCGKCMADIVYRLFGGKGYKEGAAAIAHFQSVVGDIYDKMMEQKDEFKDGSSVAGHLIRLKDVDGQPASPESIKAQIGVIIYAGHDTTGHTIGWTLFEILRNKEVEARVLKELDSLGLLASPTDPNPRDICPDDLNKLPYLNAVIKESMRYHQVVPLATYRINHEQDVVLKSGLVIPRHTAVYAMSVGVHLNPLAFPDPLKFDPERWLEPNADYVKVEYKEWESFPGAAGRLPITSSGVRSSATDVDPAELQARGYVHRFLPFAYGRRDCIGLSMAKVAVFSVLVRLLGNFRFRLAEELVGYPRSGGAGPHLSSHSESRQGHVDVCRAPLLMVVNIASWHQFLCLV